VAFLIRSHTADSVAALDSFGHFCSTSRSDSAAFLIRSHTADSLAALDSFGHFCSTSRLTARHFSSEVILLTLWLLFGHRFAWLCLVWLSRRCCWRISLVGIKTTVWRESSTICTSSTYGAIFPLSSSNASREAFRSRHCRRFSVNRFRRAASISYDTVSHFNETDFMLAF